MAYRLLQSQPNPFNPWTAISYELSQRSSVSLSIYDASGRLVRRLADGMIQEAGRQTLTWDGSDTGGHAAASGVYFYRLEAGTFAETKRMVLVR